MHAPPRKIDTSGLHAAVRLAVQRYGVGARAVRRALAEAQLGLLRGHPVCLGTILQRSGHINAVAALDLKRMEATFTRCRYARTFLGLRAAMVPRPR